MYNSKHASTKYLMIIKLPKLLFWISLKNSISIVKYPMRSVLPCFQLTTDNRQKGELLGKKTCR